ncbi:hypothetical protein DL89DRAFT_258258 [Linderina pennispora]|uniref:Uncharacterized protein n=1 Tax=Linderina pennispora TaxID=61395 RepID=A0A1Y1W6Q4_9FUNG|nr:uncharacterized protein DL89DRAFT_258258 [Linderina pennispora]ORX69201.1 hypothetical protein DL89DRAFT_258258 [Linderina pennispora]
MALDTRSARWTTHQASTGHRDSTCMTQTGMRTMPSYEGSQQGGAKWLEDEEPIHVPQQEQASYGYSDTQKQKLQPIVQADPMAMMGMGNGHRNRSMPHGQGLMPPNIQTSRPESSAASRGWMQRGGESPASAPLSSADSKDKGHSKSRLKNLFHIGRTSDSSGQKKKAGSVADQVARLEGEGSLANSSDQSSQRSANTNGRSVATVPDDSFREQRVVSGMEAASRIHVAVPPGHLSIVYPDSPMSRADTLAKSSVDSTRASGITSGHAQLVDPDQNSSSSKPAYPMQHQYSGFSAHTPAAAAASAAAAAPDGGRGRASTTLHSSSGNGGQFQGRMDSKSSGLGHHHQPARPAIPGSKAAGRYSSSNSPPFVPAHMRENVGVDSNGSSPRMYQMQRLAESDTRINERMSGSSGRAYQSRQRSTTRDTDEHSSDHDMLTADLWAVADHDGVWLRRHCVIGIPAPSALGPAAAITADAQCCDGGQRRCQREQRWSAPTPVAVAKEHNHVAAAPSVKVEQERRRWRRQLGRVKPCGRGQNAERVLDYV